MSRECTALVLHNQIQPRRPGEVEIAKLRDERDWRVSRPESVFGATGAATRASGPSHAAGAAHAAARIRAGRGDAGVCLAIGFDEVVEVDDFGEVGRNFTVQAGLEK
jgi:hypothetical protein